MICILPPPASLELFAAEYLRETNISNWIYHLLMVTCSLDALKKSSKRKDLREKRKKSKLYTVQTIYSRKEAG